MSDEQPRPMLTDAFFEHYSQPQGFDHVAVMADGSVRHIRTARGSDGEHHVTFDRTYTAAEWAALHPDESEP